MVRRQLSEQQWQTFLEVADELELPVRALLDKDVRFTAMEAAGHDLGRAVAQMTTEQLALARSQRLSWTSGKFGVRNPECGVTHSSLRTPKSVFPAAP